MAEKPSIPKGTRDFTPAIMAKRNYIFDIIKKTYQKYGFQPIETPAMENLSTLLGKYGEEGDKLLFRILDNGNYLAKVPEKLGDSKVFDISADQLNPEISGKGLRYDLTVPFARFTVQNRNEITLPFKRYQVQPVWRADRPQKGRYREFYQCDADVIGSDSLINEVEMLQIIDEVFTQLAINVIIKLNNRKILSGIAEIIGEKEKITDITVAIDKLDKIGLEKVNEELTEKGLSARSIEKLQPILNLPGSNAEKLAEIKKSIASSDTGMKGIEETEYIFSLSDQLGLKNKLELDLTLARGLNYYTGAIIEVKAADVKIGSICGGGRYDDLTGIFGWPGISGMGISFGADRIFDVLSQLNGFPEQISTTTELLFVNFGKKELLYILPLAKQARNAGINVEIYPDSTKMKKQMNYANANSIPFVAIAGEEEIKNNTVALKNMESGEQSTLETEKIIETVIQSKKINAIQ